MSREQVASQEAEHETAHQLDDSEAANDLPPSIQLRAQRLGPGDGEALKMLLRQYPELTVEIARAVAHTMGNSAVSRVVDELKKEQTAGKGKPPPPLSKAELAYFLNDPSDAAPAKKPAGELPASDHVVIGPARRASADTIESDPNP